MDTIQYTVLNELLILKWTAWIWYNSEQDSSRSYSKKIIMLIQDFFAIINIDNLKRGVLIIENIFGQLLL